VPSAEKGFYQRAADTCTAQHGIRMGNMNFPHSPIGFCLPTFFAGNFTAGIRFPFFRDKPLHTAFFSNTSVT